MGAEGDDAEAILLGRRAEVRTAVEGLAGPGAVVVLAGPAGIGKSALWREVLRDPAGPDRVLRAGAFEGDAELGYAALADLLGGLDRDVDRLPAAARDALRDGVLHPVADGPDERAVAAGLLTLLRSLVGPTLIAVDDVQWLDQSSATALGFAVRRLAGTPVRVLMTRRGEEPAVVESGLRERTTVLTLGPLGDDAVARLVADRVVGLAPAELAAAVAGAAGNPLYAIELGRHLARAGDPSALPPGIGALLGARLESAPPAAVRALAAVAVGPGLQDAELLSVVGAGAVDEAVHADLVRTGDGPPRASHPLLAPAVLAHVGPREVRRLHAELGRVVAEPLRGARHRALAAERPDEELAGEVAAAADLAAHRHDRRTACELGEHALRLTPPASPARHERRVTLAEYHAAAGDTQRCTGLLAAPEELPAGRLRARAYLVRTDVELVPLAVLERYLDLALENADDAVTRARVLVQRTAFEVRGTLSRTVAAAGWAQEAMELATGDPMVQRLALYELAWTRIERNLPVDDLLVVEAGLPGASPSFAFSVDRAAAIREMWRGELAEARRRYDVMAALCEARGEEEATQVLLTQRCELELRAGRWDEVERLLTAMGGVTRYQSGALSDPRFGAAVAAGRGDGERTRARADEAEATGGDPDVLRWPRFEIARVRGLVALLEGDSAAAVALLEPVWQHLRRAGFADPGAFPLAPDLVEALVATERRDAAAEVAAALAAVVDHPWAAAAACRARGHLAVADDADDAVAHFDEAARRYGDLGWAFDRARCLTYAGAARRALRRVREARAHLEEAVAAFDALGSPGWSRWAAAELGRLGGRRAAGSRLTDAEHQVARLAAAGRRNREVAAELFISVSTVEATLTRVYAKLGVRSRAELAGRLAAEG
ncbi:helix-turn-helix transcriptional regulator [Nocardioides nitrophenolicus]|uniref:helix-turn-helix transcriptional regulator n=1 Tax=Nocardioides nitrophenolicus TaxID=60489 RepID=UPI0019597F4E|nr:LuxR family transcriptional regulator [Nocardioides nitrophenolicus]MBM7518365.1 DNA-binding CsgD family transcriptional regulator [Nocardioides nitrophenolicus]